MNALPYLVNHRNDGRLPDPTVSDSSRLTPDGRDPMNVVIIGGSLAGLMHGIMLHRLGHHIHILDQSTAALRTDQAAGMTTGPQGKEFLALHDLYPTPYSFACPGVQIFDSAANVTRRLHIPMNLTSWNMLYYRLRANFDGLRSEFCPEPVSALEGAPAARYDLGKRAVDVTYSDGLVTVEYKDLLNGGHGTVHADLVIVADGSTSTIRRRLVGDPQRRYAGYVAWRGTVPESEVSVDTMKLFDKHHFNGFIMKRGYIVGYVMPGTNGSLEPGERLLNYVWYSNAPAFSPDFNEIMTDIDGHTHRNTLPAGKIRPEVWARQKAHAAEVLTPPFLELINKTAEPFISTVNDCAAPRASFFDGKVLLVGEALTLLRPHTGMSFNHAAMSCLLLQKVFSGELDMKQWEDEMLRYREKTMLLAIVVGSYFQGGVLSAGFLLGVAKLALAMLRQTVGKALRALGGFV